MSLYLTRFCTYLTVGIYLVLGTVVFRAMNYEVIETELPVKYFSFFTNTTLEQNNESLKLVGLDVTEIKEVVVENKNKSPKPAIKVDAKKDYLVEKVNLPFLETIRLRPVIIENNLPKNLIALYKNIESEIENKEIQIEDKVTTKLASNEGPEFFDYSSKNSTTHNVVDNIEEKIEIVENNNIDVEQVDVNDLVSFDYSKANEDIKKENIAKISNVSSQNHSKLLNTQIAGHVNKSEMTSRPKNNKNQIGKMTSQKEELANVDNFKKLVDKSEVERVYDNRTIVKITVSDLDTTKEEMGFELRPQDNLSESFSDYGSGEVVIDQKIATPSMTRSVTILKNGYSPTNTDLIVEEGVSEITVPLIESEKMNEMLAPFNAIGPVGAVLVDIDDKIESVALDTPYSKLLKLNENMQITEGEDFNYHLFLGVKAGNSLLSYRTKNGEVNSKIIHIHENEVSFDMNIYEEIDKEKVTLLEEDLLSSEKTPLIISEELVKHFATYKKLTKLRNNLYEVAEEKNLLGTRKYLELSHQEEPVYIGYKFQKNLEIPSEKFMRYVLSQFENRTLTNRCIIQVNLNKKAVRLETSSESVHNSLDLKSIILDTDGKFYDSIHEKSKKIIIQGENNNSEISQDSKVNIKIYYQDESVEYLSSYCSPNTYLVEQL